MGIRVRMHINEGAQRGLCGSCSNAIIRTDFGVSEPFISCGAYYPPRDMPRAVESCTAFEQRGQTSVRDYEKLAWILEVKKGRPMGFKTPQEAQELKLVTND